MKARILAGAALASPIIGFLCLILGAQNGAFFEGVCACLALGIGGLIALKFEAEAYLEDWKRQISYKGRTLI